MFPANLKRSDIRRKKLITPARRIKKKPSNIIPDEGDRK
jgi:hypothetical protein